MARGRGALIVAALAVMTLCASSEPSSNENASSSFSSDDMSSSSSSLTEHIIYGKPLFSGAVDGLKKLMGVSEENGQAEGRSNAFGTEGGANAQAQAQERKFKPKPLNTGRYNAQLPLHHRYPNPLDATVDPHTPVFEQELPIQLGPAQSAEEPYFDGNQWVQVGRPPSPIDATVDPHTPVLDQELPIHLNTPHNPQGQQSYGGYNRRAVHVGQDRSRVPSPLDATVDHEFVPSVQLQQQPFQQLQQGGQQFQQAQPQPLAQQQPQQVLVQVQQQNQPLQQQVVQIQQQSQVVQQQPQIQVSQQSSSSSSTKQKSSSSGRQNRLLPSSVQKRKLGSAAACEDKYAQLIEDIFIGNEMIPQVLDSAPDHVLDLSFRTARTFPGMRLDAEATRTTPMMRWPAEKGHFYTVLVSNLDINSRRNRSLSEFWHWLVVNVPEDNVKGGEVVLDLLHPLVLPEGDGDHRFGYFVFRQTGKLDFSVEGGPTANCGPAMTVGRGPFRSTKDFMRKYNLRLWAATFLIIEHSEASMDLACQWQKCMQGQVFIEDLDCPSEDSRSHGPSAKRRKRLNRRKSHNSNFWSLI